MRPACRRRPSAVSRTPGARSTRSGASATSRRNATSTSGSTASMWKPGWRTRRNASWSSLARRRRAGRSLSASPTASARARNPGASCCSISSAAVSRLRLSSPSPTVRSASGRRSARYGRRRASNAAWVHKTANVLNKLPNSLHAKAKRALQQIWMAETKTDALTAFDAFVDTYRTKYEKAVDCLTKDRDVLLAFYDFPAEHWTHLRTTNPIESVPIEQDRARHGLQAGRRRAEKLAAPARLQPVAKGHPRCEVH